MYQRSDEPVTSNYFTSSIILDDQYLLCPFLVLASYQSALSALSKIYFKPFFLCKIRVFKQILLIPQSASFILSPYPKYPCSGWCNLLALYCHNSWFFFRCGEHQQGHFETSVSPQTAWACVLHWGTCKPRSLCYIEAFWSSFVPQDWG